MNAKQTYSARNRPGQADVAAEKTTAIAIVTATLAGMLLLVAAWFAQVARLVLQAANS